jgi:DNA repair ATPase RecN
MPFESPFVYKVFLSFDENDEINSMEERIKRQKKQIQWLKQMAKRNQIRRRSVMAKNISLNNQVMALEGKLRRSQHTTKRVDKLNKKLQQFDRELTKSFEDVIAAALKEIVRKNDKIKELTMKIGQLSLGQSPSVRRRLVFEDEPKRRLGDDDNNGPDFSKRMCLSTS